MRQLLMVFAIGCLVAVNAPAIAKSDCVLNDWQNCPEVMLISPEAPTKEGIGEFRLLSNQITDVTDYKTLQLLQVLVPAGTSAEWHSHQFDSVVIPTQSAARFWFINRQTGEKKNLVLSSEKLQYLLVPAGVPHFVDLRSVVNASIVTEILISKEEWSAEDFLARTIKIDEPIPPILPFE